MSARPTARLRLTLFYASLFLASGAGLLALTHASMGGAGLRLTGMGARLSGARQAEPAREPGPSVEKPTLHTDRPGGTGTRPLYVRGPRNTAPYSDLVSGLTSAFVLAQAAWGRPGGSGLPKSMP
jgi:hypothetical protein